MGIKILFIGPTSGYSATDCGYGTACSGIGYVLNKMAETGIIEKVTFINTINFSQNKPPEDVYDISLSFFNPGIFANSNLMSILAQYYSKCKKNYFSIVWETEPLPSAWKDIWKTNIFDGFITPSYFNGKHIMKVTDKKVFYCPYYVHNEEIPKIDISDKKNEDTFTVLYVGQYTKRKGMEDAVISFTRALGYVDDARLILKYHKLGDRDIDPISLVRHTVLVNTNDRPIKSKIYSITSTLDRKLVCKLYSLSSVLLYPSRGEGFSFPTVEACSAGLPIIYNNWSATEETIVKEGNYPVNFMLDDAHSMMHHGYECGLLYAVPQIKDLISKLSLCYQEWKENKELYYNKVINNRSIIEKRFGYDAIVKHLLHIINDGKSFSYNNEFDTINNF